MLVKIYKKIPSRLRSKIYDIFLSNILLYYRKTSVSLYFHNKSWRRLNRLIVLIYVEIIHLE